MPAAETTAGTHFIAAGFSGLVAMLLATFGIEPQALVWGLVGATLGATFAPKEASRLRAACVFTCTALAAALVGTVGAEHLHLGAIWRNLMALGSAAVMHPALTAVVGQIPSLVTAVRNRVGLGDNAKAGGEQQP